MAEIWITQWLCPKRHAAFCLIWTTGETTSAVIEAQGEQLFTDHGGELNRQCGICQADTIKPEAMLTRFKSFHEAVIGGVVMAAAQAETRAALEQLKKMNRN